MLRFENNSIRIFLSTKKHKKGHENEDIEDFIQGFGQNIGKFRFGGGGSFISIKSANCCSVKFNTIVHPGSRNPPSRNFDIMEKQ